ncbi:VOC family protein [Actinomadura sediminis]|uniref:VOC family protein n=1 Tax=Actinomadura sediminis TaxID=1038904 RepID=A0ABW3F056_9ACTN
MANEKTGGISPIVGYTDVEKALEWLEKAFGFEVKAVHRDDDGNIVHTEMRHGDGVFMLSGGNPGKAANYVVVTDPDAHHDRAKAAGAEIFRELADQDYGSRDYAARDLDGNEWYFGTYRP